MKLKNVHNFLMIEYFLNTLITRAIKVILSKKVLNTNKKFIRLENSVGLESLFLDLIPLILLINSALVNFFKFICFLFYVPQIS
jgi:hypothetical protein